LPAGSRFADGVLAASDLHVVVLIGDGGAMIGFSIWCTPPC